MRFVVGHHLYFEADRPASHATLFAPDGSKLAFVNEASSFNDIERKYSWAFRRPDFDINEGDVLVFACSEFAAAGVAGGDGNIHGSSVDFSVERGEGGKPLAVSVQSPSKSVAKRVAAQKTEPKRSSGSKSRKKES